MVTIKATALGDILLHVERGDLNGFECLDVERSLLRLIVGDVVDQVELAPNPPAEKPVVFIDDVVVDIDVLVPEIREVGPELVLTGH